MLSPAELAALGQPEERIRGWVTEHGDDLIEWATGPINLPAPGSPMWRETARLFSSLGARF
ncbi:MULTISPECIES: hypothetical protein [unclassified Frankia]|uniref:hypothetical protein n=1 Tax=unclassified Frankia TaxID=2632575 RepID=UPI002AD380EF|nr:MULTISPECIES: hypothetical protein [unclassified Frankia]